MPYVDDDLAEEEINEVSGFEIEGSDITLDFNNEDIVINDGDAELIDGEDALRQWIEKIFKTRANIYEIYDTEDDESDDYDDETDEEYGSRIKDIMLDTDSARAYKLAQVQQEIESVLERHPDIISITDFEFEQKKRDLIASFTVTSVYGEENEEVVISGTDSE